jgi:oligopeptide/dipeptide ABC transporter ATP-binding protein
VPDPSKPPSGCHFHPRCPKATDICGKVDPQPRDFGSTTTGRHLVACHHAGEDSEPKSAVEKDHAETTP